MSKVILALSEAQLGRMLEVTDMLKVDARPDFMSALAAALGNKAPASDAELAKILRQLQPRFRDALLPRFRKPHAGALSTPRRLGKVRTAWV